ncbi:LacI family DNA-binding transcriptional regulator [Auraticoccus cholistanensis]|uniref:LacI family DNA-binding transcriptional regulator n=1 Tax=Auraticoccus cholistanensis TaxID=2656650 RepID=UPI002F90E9B3
MGVNGREVFVQPKRATIYEVADHAGVSHQTVSRYVRGDGGFRPATAARVEAAIRALNYRPNLTARSMRTRRTGRLAVVLPAAASHLPLRLLGAVSLAAHEEGFTVDLVGTEGGAAERAARATELADSGEVEGVLVLASLGDEPLPPTAAPVVGVADYDDQMRSLGALADGTACGEVVRQLRALGHRSLLHVAGPQSWASARNRRESFLTTVAELGLRGTVVEGDWSARSGFEAVQALPEGTDVTAVVAANDMVAMGAVRGGLERGWRVPQDLSVFGWDDEEAGRFSTPALSTVAVDRERQGREAVRRLVALLRGCEPPAPDTTSLHTVIPRESTGPAPAHRRR